MSSCHLQQKYTAEFSQSSFSNITHLFQIHYLVLKQWCIVWIELLSGNNLTNRISSTAAAGMVKARVTGATVNVSHFGQTLNIKVSAKSNLAWPGQQQRMLSSWLTAQAGRGLAAASTSGEWRKVTIRPCHVILVKVVVQLHYGRTAGGWVVISRTGIESLRRRCSETSLLSSSSSTLFSVWTETWCNKKTKKHSEPIKCWMSHILFRWDLCAYAMHFLQNWFIIHQTSLFHYPWQSFVDDEASQQPITSLGRCGTLRLAEADCLKGRHRDDTEADRPVIHHLDNHPSQAERLCPRACACVRHDKCVGPPLSTDQTLKQK